MRCLNGNGHVRAALWFADINVADDVERVLRVRADLADDVDRVGHDRGRHRRYTRCLAIATRANSSTVRK
jgi:hypothetical protein